MTKVIYRKDKKTNEVIAFLPQMTARYGKVGAYVHNGQHCDADLMYYIKDTKKASEAEYAELHKELNSIYDNELKIMQKMNYKELDWR